MIYVGDIEKTNSYVVIQSIKNNSQILLESHPTVNVVLL